MLKYENTAQIGDTIKAFDFEPMPGRDDCFLIGKVVDKGMIKHPEHGFDMYTAYTVEIVGGDDHWKGRVGETAYVPFESTFDYDGRVSRIAVAEQEEDNKFNVFPDDKDLLEYDDELANTGAHLIAAAEQEWDDDLAEIGKQIVAQATVKTSKTKKQAAAELYKQFSHKGRKYVIDLYMTELNMSKAGASTYYYNCKKGA